jgi:PAS domain S-box-containing protein
MSGINQETFNAAAKLAAIVESSDDAIIGKDLDGVITSWNRGAEQLFGYTADEALGRPVTILIPDDRVNDEEPHILARIRRGERVDHYETVRRHKDGRLLEISLTVSPIFDEHRNIIGASKIARDVSARKQTDAEIARLASIVQSSGDAIVSKDLNGIITSWNRGATDLFGYTADEMIGRSVTTLIPDDHLDEEPAILAQIRRGQRVEHYETIRRHKDGRLLDISLTVSPLYDSAGRIVGASKTARDITQRKRVEAELTRLAAIVESSSDAIISKDLNGIIMSWNAGAEAIFGYTADEVIGKPVTILMPPERVNEEPGILRRIRNGERIDHYETIRRHKDGRLLNISLNVSPVYDSHGVIIGASKIARDITERKAADEARRESQIMHRLVEAQESERHRIARDLHDHLGQRMTALRLKIETMIKKADGSEDLQADFDGIRRAALQIDRDIGFLSWELRPTELDELGLEDALASFVREWSAQYDINANFEGNIHESEAGLPDKIETNLYRILQEALNNILKHAAAQNVSVILQERANRIVLIIEDDGRGFDTTGYLGIDSPNHGLGLIGMHERAAMLKGSLEIESAPGKGTTILVHVPL